MKTNVNFKAREKLLTGVDTMADAVASTLGPVSSSVAIAKANPRGEIYERIVLKDGVSVARAIDLEDEDENMGAQLLKETSQKQVDSVGDGTTVVMILAQAIIHEAYKLIALGANGMQLRKGLEEGQAKLIAALQDHKTEVTSSIQTKAIATISAEDEELGQLVSEVLQKQGADGIVVVEPSKSTETAVEYQTGLQLDHGYANDFFVTNPDRMEAVLTDTHILLTDKSIMGLVELQTVLNKIVETDKKIVFIAPEFSTEVLGLLAINKAEGKLLPVCIKSPSFLTQQKAVMNDIAIMTGGIFISEESGLKFEDVRLEHLGKAQSVTVTKTLTTIVGGKGKSEEIDARIQSLRTQLEEETDDYEKEKLKERLAKMTTGVCVIRVGGMTEVEMKERRERVLDAVSATQAAMESGIVPGGETVYLKIRQVLDQTKPAEKILFEALERPFTKLLENAGLNSGRYLEKLESLEGKVDHVGVDVTDGECKDLVVAGIIDPLAVPLNAIQNAVSVANQIISTNVVITPRKEEKE